MPSPPVVRATARSGGSGRNSKPYVDWSPVNRSHSASSDFPRRVLHIGHRQSFYLGALVVAPVSVL